MASPETFSSPIVTSAGVSDVDAMRRQFDALTRQQTAVLAFGRRANDHPCRMVLIQDAVALLAEILGAELGVAGELVGGGQKVLLKVATVDKRGRSVDLLEQTLPCEEKESLAAYVLTNAESVLCEDLNRESRFTDHFLRRLGVVAGLVVPLHLCRHPIGLLGVFCKRRRMFSGDDIRFAETLACLVCSSLDREEAERMLRQQQRFSGTMMRLVDELMFVTDKRGRILDMSHAAIRYSGFTLESVRGESLVSTMIAPESTESFDALLHRLARQGGAQQYAADLLTKHGERRKLDWMVETSFDEQQRVESFVLVAKEIRQENEALPGSNYPKPYAQQTVDTPAFEAEPGQRQPEIRPFEPIDGNNGREMRRSPRRSFCYQQQIAPMYGGIIPSRKKFFSVVCCDISAGGVSFYLENTPEFEDLVVSLGQVPDLTYFTARVVRTAEKIVDGQPCCLVGCRFTGRVHF